MATLSERIGQIVKSKRQRDRLTQSDLGGRIGVSGSYISGVEANQTSPRIAEIEALAQVFRTTAFDLIVEAAQPDTRTFTDANRERNAFLNVYDALSPANQQQARTFLRFLREQQQQEQSGEH
jgi:transcriptional regulator with XRE-family HTH domain